LDSTSWQRELVEEGNAHLLMNRKQGTRKGLGTSDNLQRHVPRDPLPPAKPYFLKIPQLPQIMPPPSGNQVFNT
jgi:hypothetical protein